VQAMWGRVKLQCFDDHAKTLTVPLGFWMEFQNQNPVLLRRRLSVSFRLPLCSQTEDPRVIRSVLKLAGPFQPNLRSSLPTTVTASGVSTAQHISFSFSRRFRDPGISRRGTSALEMETSLGTLNQESPFVHAEVHRYITHSEQVQILLG
jgi:hypothetical protein